MSRPDEFQCSYHGCKNTISLMEDYCSMHAGSITAGGPSVTGSRVLVAFDPGLRVAGVAVFNLDTKELIRALLIRNSVADHVRGAECWAGMADRVYLALGSGTAIAPDAFACEVPQVYQNRGGAKNTDGVDPKDLVELACVSAAVLGRLQPVKAKSYFPSQWKGQVAKDVHNRMVQERLLHVHELDRIERAGALTHNIIDAVGIGLYYLGRRQGIR